MRTARENLESSPTFAQLPKFALAPAAIETIESPREFGVDILRQIMCAKKRIWISALYIENDMTGNRILDALRSAKITNPELEVKVFVDFHRNQRSRVGEKKDAAAIEKFRNANFDIIGVPIATRERKGVLHTKGIIIDDTITFSGASFNNVYLHGEDKKKEERQKEKDRKLMKMKDGDEEEKNKYRIDRYWKFHDKNLAESFVQYFKEVFEESEATQDFTEGRVKIRKKSRSDIEDLQLKLHETNFRAEDPLTKIDNSQTYVVPIAGFGKGNPVTQTIIDLINAAERNVTIYTPYFNISKDVRAAIKGALEAGKKVRIVVGDKTANDFYRSPEQIKKAQKKKMSQKEKAKLFIFDALPYTYEQNLREFATEFRGAIEAQLLDIRLWQDGENTFHPKGVVVDDGEVSFVTGHNINQRGDEKDLENGIVIVTEDESIKEKTRAELKNILQHAERLENPKDLPEKSTYSRRTLRAMKILAHGEDKF